MRTLSAILCILGVVVGCSQNRPPGLVIAPPTAAQIAEFTNKANITLPVSAQPVGWRELRGIDDVLWLQVRMPAQELPVFLDCSPFRGAEFETNENNPLCISGFPGFLTAPPMRSRSADQQLPKGRALRILIDESESKNVVVYLRWLET